MDLLYRIVRKPHLQNLCKPLFIRLWDAHSFPQYCVLASSHINMLCCVALITTLVICHSWGTDFWFGKYDLCYLSAPSRLLVCDMEKAFGTRQPWIQTGFSTCWLCGQIV